jgi:hypothetical protein
MFEKTCLQAVYNLSKNGSIVKSIIGNSRDPEILLRTQKIAKRYMPEYEIHSHYVNEKLCRSLLCKYVCNFVYSEEYKKNGHKNAFRVEK